MGHTGHGWAVLSSGCYEHLQVNVLLQSLECSARLEGQRAALGGSSNDRFEQYGELHAGGQTVEAHVLLAVGAYDYSGNPG